MIKKLNVDNNENIDIFHKRVNLLKERLYGKIL
jgi:hypothetical protein